MSDGLRIHKITGLHVRQAEGDEWAPVMPVDGPVTIHFLPEAESSEPVVYRTPKLRLNFQFKLTRRQLRELRKVLPFPSGRRRGRRAHRKRLKQRNR